MIRTKFNISCDRVLNAPDTWIFEYYCKLQEKLHGQTLTITSVFNPVERTPSMKLYYLDGNYRFKDFSSGKEGGSILLVSQLFGLSFDHAVIKINKDYANDEKKVVEIVSCEKVPGYKVTSHVKRKWNELDVKFWTQFNIGSKLLGRYNVHPISEYTLSKPSPDGIKEINIKRQVLYGYFKNDGTLYKIYQPYSAKKKFLELERYIQGSEQLEFKAPILIIGSSLKDIMSLDTLNFNVEGVAPSSENTMIPKSILSAYSLKYKGIMTFFDNDAAGHMAMAKYNDKYGIPGIHLKMSKDLSDSIRDFGVNKTKQYLTPLIPKV